MGKFLKCYEKQKFGAKDPPMTLVFHGTNSANLGNILKNGLNKKFRGMHGQMHGPGEYFTPFFKCALSWNSRNTVFDSIHGGPGAQESPDGGYRMLVFALLDAG